MNRAFFYLNVLIHIMYYLYSYFYQDILPSQVSSAAFMTKPRSHSVQTDVDVHVVQLELHAAIEMFVLAIQEAVSISLKHIIDAIYRFVTLMENVSIYLRCQLIT